MQLPADGQENTACRTQGLWGKIVSKNEYVYFWIFFHRVNWPRLLAVWIMLTLAEYL